MLFEDPAKKYPHLVQALNVLSRRDFSPIVPYAGPGVGIGGFIAGLIVYGATGSFFTGCMVMLAMAIAGIALSAKARRQAQKPVDQRAVEATEVAKGMGQMLAKRRLHRDLDEGSLMLMEECSRQWLRAKNALNAPFWTSGEAPVQYHAFRTQALEALDDSMDDVLLHFRNFVPDDVPNRHAMDYVEEALEQFNPRGKRGGPYMTPSIGPVMEIAEKLSQLASEAERMANESAFDSVAPQAPQAKTLDETLRDLREIKQAEDELRQNLRG